MYLYEMANYLKIFASRNNIGVFTTWIFLVACTQLYDPLCPSVGPSVCWSVCLLVPDAFFFFSPFYVVRSLFKSFYILAFSLLVLTTARDLEVLALFLFLFIFFLSSCLQNLLAAYKHCLRAWALCRSLNKDRDEIIQISIWAGAVIKKPLVNTRTNSVMDGRMDGRSNGLTELVVQTPDRH